MFTNSPNDKYNLENEVPVVRLWGNLQKALKLSLPTMIMAWLTKLGIVKEITGKKRKQVFAYQACWKFISKEMEKT